MCSKKIQNPPPEEKVCMNCKHLLWMVAIGQGVKCRARNMYAIPNRWYSCEKFEYREEPNKHRIGKLIVSLNFGLLHIDWSKPAVTFEIRNQNNKILLANDLW